MLHPYFENTLQLLGVTQTLNHDSGDVVSTYPLNLSFLRDVPIAYEVSNRINWCGAFLNFKVIVSAGATAGNLDINFRASYLDSSGNAFNDSAYCGTPLQITAAMLGTTGTFYKTFSVLTEDYGPLSDLVMSYSSGDLHSTISVRARRWCYV